MEDNGLKMLARMVLAKAVFDYFLITDIKYIDTKSYDEPEMHIYLYEKMHSELQNDVHFESKGFIDRVK